MTYVCNLTMYMIYNRTLCSPPYLVRKGLFVVVPKMFVSAIILIAPIIIGPSSSTASRENEKE